MNTKMDIIPIKPLALEEPEGQVPLESAFYAERPPVEADCYETIVKPGALIRIKAPRQMGKSSLMSRILDRAAQQGCQTAFLNFQLADAEYLANLDGFLKWFCTSVTEELNLDNKLPDYWQGVVGAKNKSTKYFQKYLLTEISAPVVVGLDEVDRLFQYPDIAAEFFALLRTWHERGKNEPTWKKLRLAIAHSQEVYIPLNINQSPFNVGLPVELPELNQSQVENLVQRHGLDCSGEQIEQLMGMFGGHPYLVRVALYEIARGRTSLETLLQVAPTEEGPYYDHLRRLLVKLEKDAQLAEAFKQVVAASHPVEVKTTEAFKLRSMGLVKLRGNAVMPLCDLYRQYFRDRLKVTAPARVSQEDAIGDRVWQDNLKQQSALAAIVFTDVVNSTEQMLANQQQMLELLKRDFDFMRECCHRYNGQVLKSMGDGLLMYFASAVSAVACALELQRTFSQLAAKLPSDRVLIHRIGIHLGDVFLSGGDVLGAGVNLAARLQNQAKPGGICISQTVYEVVKNHLRLTVEDLGPQPLKGITDPVSLYQVIP